MKQNLLDAEAVCDGTDMLATSPTKADENVVPRICTSLHRDLENRLSHAGIRDFEEACCDFIVAALEARLRKFPADPFQSGDRQVLVRAERESDPQRRGLRQS